MSEESSIDLEELGKQYEEKGFFRRLIDMFKGLGQPKNSREYKLARVELQRLAAPLIAIVVPVLGVIILIVVTAVTSSDKSAYQVEVARAEEEVESLQDEEEPPDEEIDMTQDVDVQVDVDVAAPAMESPAPPSPSPGGEPDKVAQVVSPVTMASVPASPKRGVGDGDGGGFGTILPGNGKGQSVAGCLVGVLVDLKRNADGSKKPYDANKAWTYMKELYTGNFSGSALSKFYSPDKRVALSKVYIPECNATQGPEAFGAKDFGGSGWCAYYSGNIKCTEKARYRFVGYFDEFMLVKIGGKVVLECSWGFGPQNGTKPNAAKPDPGRISGWVPKDKTMVGKWQSPQGNSRLVVGDWFDADPGKNLKMEVVLGESAGGKCGGILLIQKEGVKYSSKGNHDVLPVFSSKRLTVKEKDRLAADGYGICPDAPLFNSKKSEEQKAVIKNDVSVEVDI